MKDVCLIDHSVCADLVPLPSLVSCSDPWEVFHEACETSVAPLASGVFTEETETP